MRRINWKSLTIAIVLILLLTLTAGIVFWMRSTMGPSTTAMNALQTDDQVSVTQTPEFVAFAPVDEFSPTAFIFYPGAGVDPRSYAPILRQIAARGYLAVVVNMPLNLAVFNSDAADAVIAAYPIIDNWVIGGHSLGGVVAASFAADQPAIDGTVFLASYPANDALKDSDIPILSIYGSLDGLATPQDIEDSRPLLPADTVFLEIEGGNHSQMGSYGLQKGDNEATITPEAQWSQIVEAIVTLLNTVSE